MHITSLLRKNLAGLAVVLGLQPVCAQVPPPPDGEQALAGVYTGESYSPYGGRGFPSQVYWGDTHLHTSFSMDAGAFGNRLGLDEAYRFERGEEVTSQHPEKLNELLAAWDHYAKDVGVVLSH